MLIRKRKKPLVLQKTDALISRLPAHHPKQPHLQQKAAQYQLGYNGERKLDYYTAYLSNDFAILNDVTLTAVKGMKFQIDSLIITERAMYLIESKNFKGVVTFDTNLKQCIREYGEKLDGFDYPITHMENTQLLFRQWLHANQLAGLPIYSFIAFANSETIIKVTGDKKNIMKKVTYANAIPTKLMQVNDSIEKKSKPLKGNIISKVLKQCEDFDIDIINKMNIEKVQILPGVKCEKCKTLGMIWKHRKWNCEQCRSTSIDAHHQAFRDYILLIGKEITNEQCRKFLRLNSRHQAITFLRKSPFQLKKGSRIWRV